MPKKKGVFSAIADLLAFRGGTSTAPPLGRVLVKDRVITSEQLSRALAIQKNDPQRLGQIIVEQGYATEVEILQAITKEYRVSAASLKDDISGLVSQAPRTFLDRILPTTVPIGAKLSIAITSILWLAILTLSFIILMRQRENLYLQTVKTGKISLNYFVGDAAISLIEDDIVRLNTLIKESSSVEGLAFVAIADREGTMKAHSDTALIGAPLPPPPARVEVVREGDISYYNAPLEGEQVLHISRPVSYSDVELGKVVVGISLDFIDRQIRKESITVIVLSIFFVLLGIAVAIKIGVGFSRPISLLVDATHQIGMGNFRHRINEVRKDELGDLAAAFNYMSRELWKKLKMQKSFGSYVSPEILEMIMAAPDAGWLQGRRMKVSVLFTDVRGFTAFSEECEPEKVVEAVNRYFAVATRHIILHGGYVDKFIGDAVLGVFGAPVERPDHAARAVKAALGMRDEFRSRAGDENPFFGKVGIGINSGEAVAGDLGSEVKKEYSVIGDCVNLASRINSLAEADQIIISRSTFEETEDIVDTKALPAVMVKGKAGEVHTFEVVGLREGRT